MLWFCLLFLPGTAGATTLEQHDAISAAAITLACVLLAGLALTFGRRSQREPEMSGAPFGLSQEALGYLTQNPYSYPQNQLPRNENLLGEVTFPAESPFTPACFEREDETDDGDFYSQPRFLTHIDDEAIAGE